jgi:hypothetical protein
MEDLHCLDKSLFFKNLRQKLEKTPYLKAGIPGECRLDDIHILPSYGGFRVMAILPPRATRRKRTKSRDRQRRLLRRRQRRLLDRIAHLPEPEREVPMITAANIHYELGQRTHGLAAGGLGAMLLIARRTGLIAAIDHHLHLLKRHLPYFESDHVLNIALNILAGGRRLEHLELRRTDEVYLDALGAVRVPTRPPPATSAAASARPTSWI